MFRLPASLQVSSSLPFVGRAVERATLVSLLPRGPEEPGRLVLVAGEAGSGKSRLMRELAVESANEGAVVLYGSCDAVVSTPYQPFVEALDHLVREADPALLREALAANGGELTRVLPNIGRQVAELPPRVEADPDTERHRLHVAVTNLLARVTRDQPLLLAIEDIHWADVPSLHLLRHLARAGADARMLLLLTVRDDEPEPSADLAEALADLARAAGIVRLHLEGLTAEEIAEFVRRAAGDIDEADAAALGWTIRELTEGNPFLVCELWRDLSESGALAIESGRLRLLAPAGELASPDAVREVVSGRLARLSQSARELLELASLIGREFELRVVDRAAGMPHAKLRAALEAGVESGLIEELPPLGIAYRFTHELVRRALADGMSSVRRAALHLRLGEALEHLHAANREAVLPELAHHFAAATPVDGGERAVDYSVRAARAASASLAHDEAARLLRTALSIGIDDERERALVQLDLGTTLNLAGRTIEALECFHAAAAIGRAVRDAGLLARAAVGVEEACWRPGIVDQGAVGLLREALEAQPDGDSAERAGLLAGLSRALFLVGRREEAATVRAEGVEVARRTGDRRALAAALIQGYWAPGAATHHDVLEMLAEARALGEKLGDLTVRAEAIAWRVVTLAALADLGAAGRELESLRAAAEQSRQPFIHHAAQTFGSALALCDGRLGAAEEMAERAREWGDLMGGPDPSGAYGLQLFNVRQEQGRLGEIMPIVERIAGEAGGRGYWRPALLALLVDVGMEDEAARELRRATEEGIAAIRQDAVGLAGLVYLADAASALADRDAAAAVYRELEPLAGRPIVIGHLVACYGATDRYLGKLAAAFEDWHAAERHFERALALNERMGAPLWLAYTRYEYGRMLQARGRPDDRSRAGELFAGAASLAGSIGAQALSARIEASRPPADAAEFPDDLSPREVTVLELVARGLSNREIGEELVISEHTAANHVRSILRKTRCANRTEATAYAYRKGLVGT